MRALVPFLISYALGGLLVGAMLPRLGRRPADLALGLALAGPFGFSLGSCAYFLSLALDSPQASSVLLIEAAAAALLGALAWDRRAEAGVAPALQIERSGWTSDAAIVLPVFAGLALFCAGAFLYYLPHGSWDAWGSWNMRAKFLARLGEDWRATFGPGMAHIHANYPLLLTGSVARGWLYAGSETKAVPAGIALVFLFSSAGLLASALARAGRAAWPLAPAALLATPAFVVFGASQIADVPLAFFYLAALWAMAEHARAGEAGAPFAAAAGFAAASAAWTKNEGALFLAVATALWLARMFASPERRPGAARSALAYLAGAAPALAALAWFKFGVAPPNDLVAAQGSEATLARLADPARYLAVLGGLAGAAHSAVFAFNRLGLAGGWFLLPAVWFFAREKSPEAARGLRFGGAILLLVLGGYMAAYLVTPYDIAWHMQTSCDRLLMQLWPSALFVIFASTRAAAPRVS